MDALAICFINRAVAPGACLWDDQPRPQQELTGILVRKTSLGVGIMAIGADRSIFVPCRKCTLMDAIQCFCILLGMALLTGGIELQRKIARTAGYHLGMWETGDIRMAVHTTNIFCSMDRGCEFCRINGDGKWLSPDLGSHAWLLMTG
jgi:hypothetical protein